MTCVNIFSHSSNESKLWESCDTYAKYTFKSTQYILQLLLYTGDVTFFESETFYLRSVSFSVRKPLSPWVWESPAFQSTESMTRNMHAFFAISTVLLVKVVQSEEDWRKQSDCFVEKQLRRLKLKDLKRNGRAKVLDKVKSNLNVHRSM